MKTANGSDRCQIQAHRRWLLRMVQRTKMEWAGGKKRSSKIFGFSVTHNYKDDETGTGSSPVTRQFFPVDEAEMRGGEPPNFPRAHWVGVQFWQSCHSLSRKAAADLGPGPPSIAASLVGVPHMGLRETSLFSRWSRYSSCSRPCI